jgi:hypothetical protein
MVFVSGTFISPDFHYELGIGIFVAGVEAIAAAARE